MALYLEVAKKSFQRHLAYRAANLAGILTNTFFGTIYVFVFIALFQTQDQMGGFNLQDTVTYVVVSQSLLMVMSAFGSRDLSDAIIRGEIATDLSRPMDFYLYWGALDLGRAIYYLLFRGVPTFVIGWILFRATVPWNPMIWLLFLLSLLAGSLVSFSFRFITNCLAFWTSQARGINYLTSTMMLFFGGFAVPLNFFPSGLRTLAELLPFRAFVQLPITIYLGKTNSGELAQAFALEVIWLIVLTAAGRMLLGRMVSRLTVNGG